MAPLHLFPRALPGAAFAAWMLICGSGLSLLWNYSQEPGRSAQAPARWPARSELPAPDGEPLLLLVAHPRCPCTRATLEELDRLLARCPEHGATMVLFYTPPDEPESWARSDLWAHAARIPGVAVWADPGGRQAALLGVSTSGQVLLYGADGTLLYQGGLTASRGHAGESAGSHLLEALLREESRAYSESPVFGCPIQDTSCSPPP